MEHLGGSQPAPWKRYAVIVVVAVLALAGAFVGGRFSAPLQVQTIDTVSVKFQDRVVEKVVTVEKVVQAQAKIVYRDRVITKDGTITEHEVEKTDTKTDTVKTAEGVKVSDRASSIDTVKQTTVTLRPSWRVGLTVGASWPKPLLAFAGPLVIGVQVDYRIIGGLTAGVWLNTFGAAGVGLSFEF